MNDNDKGAIYASVELARISISHIEDRLTMWENSISHMRHSIARIHEDLQRIQTTLYPPIVEENNMEKER